MRAAFSACAASTSVRAPAQGGSPCGGSFGGWAEPGGGVYFLVVAYSRQTRTTCVGWTNLLVWEIPIFIRGGANPIVHRSTTPLEHMVISPAQKTMLGCETGGRLAGQGWTRDTVTVHAWRQAVFVLNKTSLARAATPRGFPCYCKPTRQVSKSSGHSGVR